MFYVTKLQKLSDMTKPRLAKVRALFYVLQQVTKEAAPILTQPLCCIIAGESEIAAVFVALAEEEFVVDVFLCGD